MARRRACCDLGDSGAACGALTEMVSSRSLNAAWSLSCSLRKRSSSSVNCASVNSSCTSILCGHPIVVHLAGTARTTPGRYRGGGGMLTKQTRTKTLLENELVLILEIDGLKEPQNFRIGIVFNKVQKVIHRYFFELCTGNKTCLIHWRESHCDYWLLLNTKVFWVYITIIVNSVRIQD